MTSGGNIYLDLPEERPPASGMKNRTTQEVHSGNQKVEVSLPGHTASPLPLIMLLLALSAAGMALFVLLKPCGCGGALTRLEQRLDRVERSRIEADSRLRSEIRGNVATTLPGVAPDE